LSTALVGTTLSTALVTVVVDEATAPPTVVSAAGAGGGVGADTAGAAGFVTTGAAGATTTGAGGVAGLGVAVLVAVDATEVMAAVVVLAVDATAETAGFTGDEPSSEVADATPSKSRTRAKAPMSTRTPRTIHRVTLLATSALSMLSRYPGAFGVNECNS
jgi:hypothetical protein